MSNTKTIKYPSGVILRRTYDEWKETWEIDNKALSVADFTLDISSCEGVHFDNDEYAKKQTVSVPPQTVDQSLKLTKVIPWKFSASFSLSETPLSLEEQKSALETVKQEWDRHLEEREKVFKTIPYEVLDSEDIKYQMEQKGQDNFIDPHFPPRDISLYNVLEDQYPYNFVVQWRRPHEFMENPVVFEDDVDPNDIKQGQLGDCWFLSALSSLAERPGMVKRLFITKEYNKEGIYKIKMCKNGEWVTVTIDDYIPCRYNGGPMFSRGGGNELWVMLIEKAYAKLHGNYQALSAGFTKHAMVDLSGCPTEHLDFPKEKEDFDDIEEEADEIFEKMREADEEGYLISTETSGVDTITEGDGPASGGGLVSGHAYSVIQVKEALGNKLLNIRNPWGQFEWNGAWADNAEEWTDEMIEELEPEFNDSDGSFWMCLEDFIMKFEAVNFCKIENYNEARFKGKFLRCKSKDHQQEHIISKFFYTFQVEEDNDITIGLHQEDERIVGAHLRRYLDTGCVILKLEDEDDTEGDFFDYLEFTREREHFKTISFEAGTYALVPMTSGAMMQKTMNGKTEPINPKFKFEDTVWPHPYFSSALTDIFRKIDLAVNGLLSAEELNQFGKIVNEPLFMDIKRADFTSQTFKDVSCNEEGVSLLGFKQLLFRNFSNYEISAILEKLGYDEALNSTKSRAFMISLQATEPISVDIKDILTTDFHRTAWIKLLNSIYEEEGPGDFSTVQDDYTLFSYTHPASYTSSYLVLNNSESHLKVTLDLTSSDSCLFVPTTGVITKIVPPESSAYMGTMACDPDAYSYSFSYDVDAEEVEVEEPEEDEPEEDDEEAEGEGSDQEADEEADEEAEEDDEDQSEI
jgi:calpain-15